jgi:hypothetical protein
VSCRLSREAAVRTAVFNDEEVVDVVSPSHLEIAIVETIIAIELVDPQTVAAVIHDDPRVVRHFLVAVNPWRTLLVEWQSYA